MVQKPDIQYVTQFYSYGSEAKVLELKPDERGKLYVTLTMPYGYSGSHVNRIWPIVDGVRLENPIIVKVTTRK